MNVRFAPKATVADPNAIRRFVPEGDQVRCSERGPLFDHVVGSVQQAKWHAKTQCSGGLEVDDELVFVGA